MVSEGRKFGATAEENAGHQVADQIAEVIGTDQIYDVLEMQGTVSDKHIKQETSTFYNPTILYPSHTGTVTYLEDTETVNIFYMQINDEEVIATPEIYGDYRKGDKVHLITVKKSEGNVRRYAALDLKKTEDRNDYEKLKKIIK